MQTLDKHSKPTLDFDAMSWLFTAYGALRGHESEEAQPEIKALRRALEERHPEVIAVSLEVVCSHLAGKLTSLQSRLTARLADHLRSGNVGRLRRTVTALARESMSTSAFAV